MSILNAYNSLRWSLANEARLNRDGGRGPLTEADFAAADRRINAETPLSDLLRMLGEHDVEANQ